LDRGLSPAGAFCRESDGQTYYNLIHYSVELRADGHGTFLATTEQGMNKPSQQHPASLPLPQGITLQEVHPTLSIQSF
jgi:hypothetical protein